MKIWKTDPSHSSVEFVVPHMVIGEVKGIFQRFDTILKVNGLEFEKAQLEVQIETDSIFTNFAPRDKHLRSSDFFETDKYPYMTFKSMRFLPKENRKYDIEGYLTIKNISLPFTLHAQYRGMQIDPWGNDRIGFTAEGKLNRILWGLKWNNLLQNGAFVVGHEVRILVACELIQEDVYQGMLQRLTS